MTANLRSLAAASLILASALALAAAASVEGTYKANGKDGKLAHVVAFKGRPFMDKPVIQLVFSEKDAGKSKSPDMDAQFGHLGDALAIKLQKGDEHWDVIGCELNHAALKNSGASASGLVDIKDVTVANGEISGHLFTAKNAKVFDEPVEIDLRFHVKQP